MLEYSEAMGQGTRAIKLWKFWILVPHQTKNSHKLLGYDGPIIEVKYT